MKTVFSILIISAIIAINVFDLNAQKVRSQYLYSDSDSLAAGNFYLIELKNHKEYLGKVLKTDSLSILITDQNNEMLKIKRTKINKCLNIFTNPAFDNTSLYNWIVNTGSGYYYDNVIIKGTGVKKDLISFWLPDGKEINLSLKKIESVEIYNNFNGELESDPMNMFFPYMLFKNNEIKTDEYDLSGLSSQWKAAEIKYLIYKY